MPSISPPALQALAEQTPTSRYRLSLIQTPVGTERSAPGWNLTRAARRAATCHSSRLLPTPRHRPSLTHLFRPVSIGDVAETSRDRENIEVLRHQLSIERGLLSSEIVALAAAQLGLVAEVRRIYSRHVTSRSGRSLDWMRRCADEAAQ